MSRILLLLATFIFSISASFAAPTFYIAPILAYAKMTAEDNSFYYGISPKLVVGVGDFVLYERFFLAAEGFGMPWKAYTTSSNAKENAQIRINSSYGIDLIPGVYLDYGLRTYGILGFARSKFGGDFTLNGTQLGVGIDINVGDTGFIVRVAYVNTRYSNSKSTNGTITANEGDLGVVFKFGGGPKPC